MSERHRQHGIGAREGAAAQRGSLRAVPARRGGKRGCDGAFLLHQLLAWPPHEDETLPLFIGRHPLDQVFQVVLEERGGAPLHFLIAWAVAHLDLGLEGLRAFLRAFAIASLPVIALLLARLAERAFMRWSRPSSSPRAGRSSSTPSTGGCTASSSSQAPCRIWRCFTPSNAVGGTPGRSGRWRSWQRSRRIRTGRSCCLARRLRAVAQRDRLREAVWAFGAVAVIGIPFWLTDLVLAGRFDAGVGAGGDKLDGPLSVVS